MRSALLVLVLVVPALFAIPNAHADCSTWRADVDTGVVYTYRTPGSSWYPAEANGMPIGVAIDVCWWSGTHTYTWRESNGTPGLQTGGGVDCVPDALVAWTFTGARLTCTI